MSDYEDDFASASESSPVASPQKTTQPEEGGKATAEADDRGDVHEVQGDKESTPRSPAHEGNEGKGAHEAAEKEGGTKTPHRSPTKPAEATSSPANAETGGEAASPAKESTPPRSPTPLSSHHSSPHSSRRSSVAPTPEDTPVNSPTKDAETKSDHDGSGKSSARDSAGSTPGQASPSKPTDDSKEADPEPEEADKEERKGNKRDSDAPATESPSNATDRRSSASRSPPDESPSQRHGTPTSSQPPPSQSKIAQRKRLPPRSGAVAAVSYPGEHQVAVADILDPTRPLVKSTKPTTRPLGPSFVESETAEQRRQRRLQTKSASAERTTSIAEQRMNERKYLKAQQEFEREKRLAERAIYHRERVSQWATRLGASPLGVDLVADHERIDEEAFVRQREEKRRQALAEKRKRRIKNEIIVKALAEVPLLEEARRQKREMLEEERRAKALRDVQRVEAIQARKVRDMAVMEEERRAKLDQRLMNS